VEDGKLGRIEETARVHAVSLDKVSPLSAAIGQVETCGCGAEGAVGTGDAARGFGNALAGAGGGHNHQAGFSAVLSRRRAADYFNGLNGIRRNLVGKYLALLIGD